MPSLLLLRSFCCELLVLVAPAKLSVARINFRFSATGQSSRAESRAIDVKRALAFVHCHKLYCCACNRRCAVGRLLPGVTLRLLPPLSALLSTDFASPPFLLLTVSRSRFCCSTYHALCALRLVHVALPCVALISSMLIRLVISLFVRITQTRRCACAHYANTQ